MEPVLKTKRSTIKSRLISFWQIMLIVSVVFMLVMLQFSLRMVDLCSKTMDTMSDLEGLFEEISNAGKYSDNYLLYADEASKLRLDETIVLLGEYVGELRQVQVSDSFHRSVLDIEGALRTLEAGVRGMPGMDSSAKEMLAYYETDFLPARSAYVGMMKEEAEMSNQLLTVSAFLREKQTRWIYRYAAIMALLLVFWGILISRYSISISRQVAQPIERLTQTVQQVDYDRIEQVAPISIDPGADWEVENLSCAFNAMIARMQAQWQSLQEKAEMEKTLREQEMENLRMAGLLKTSQLQALQRQINPHFLFNTLNVIMDTAYFEEAPETVELLRCAAAFLRYSLDCCEKEVTLSRELEALGEYVFLQEKRFGNRIRFEFEIDEALGDTRVPALILQPLVENAVAYGVGAYAKGGLVQIITSQEADGMVRICVRDNGNGISDEALVSLRERLKRAAQGESVYGEKHGIGLANVARKLQVYYRGGATITVTSKPGDITQVSLLLPVQED